ncbi:acetyltransferase (GNAT) family protein [Tumebacillus sp. BK434]|uniref:GNAT family N-acetyltransferase n=1 Tax=Tumebacillus sp. BK434 TaxID=2512169 RepID=UPI0010EEB0BA|nr:GNAT family N-acetyltransferase [Tumebacillus sp. BK434]TCP52630.1 acetyltransferase (GNAT) family protein [Tumebacillus sp. BK434]
MIERIPVCPSDETFLYQLYASTRMTELQAWGWDPMMQEQFLQMQWNAQRQSYAVQYPDAEHSILTFQNFHAGRVLVSRTTEAIVLVDISLLPAFHNRGIGTWLIQELQAEAQALKLTLRLSVLPQNPALRLYERLGFRTTDQTGHHVLMEWRAVSPDATPSDKFF